MAKGSLWYRTKCAATLMMMVLLMGTESSDELTCNKVFLECSTIAMDLGSAVTEALQKGGDVAALCASGIPNLTSCQERAQAACSDVENSHVEDVNQMVNTAKTKICAGALASTCIIQASTCFQDMGSVMENRTSMELVSMTCRLAPSISACKQRLDAKCREKPEVKTMFQFLEQAETQCADLTNNGECNEGLTCLSFIESSSGQAPSCSVLNSFVSCLDEKVREGLCVLDESKVTIAKVKKLMNDLCGEVDKQACESASTCMTPTGFPSDPPSRGDPASIPRAPTTPSLTDPAFICNFMVSASSCYVGMENDCSYGSDLVESMKATHQDLKKECPADPSGGATGLVPEVMCLVTAILTSWMAVYTRL